MADNGTLFQHDLNTGDWVILLKDEAYRSYSLVEVCLKLKLVVVSNIHGEVCLLRDGV